MDWDVWDQLGDFVVEAEARDAGKVEGRDDTGVSVNGAGGPNANASERAIGREGSYCGGDHMGERTPEGGWRGVAAGGRACS